VSVFFVLRIAREAPKKLYEDAIVVAIALGESMAFQDRGGLQFELLGGFCFSCCGVQSE